MGSANGTDKRTAAAEGGKAGAAGGVGGGVGGGTCSFPMAHMHFHAVLSTMWTRNGDGLLADRAPQAILVQVLVVSRRDLVLSGFE